jgi:acyl-CoA synthetase (AMP-forming)/AMP-acid ligase II
VVAVPNHETRQLCGAVVRIRQNPKFSADKSTVLSQIHSDLKTRLPAHMLPVHLRVLGDDEMLPRTVSGKCIKREILEKYFGAMDGQPPATVPPGVEFCQLGDPDGLRPQVASEYLMDMC